MSTPLRNFTEITEKTTALPGATWNRFCEVGRAFSSFPTEPGYNGGLTSRIPWQQPLRHLVKLKQDVGPCNSDESVLWRDRDAEIIKYFDTRADTDHPIGFNTCDPSWPIKVTNWSWEQYYCKGQRAQIEWNSGAGKWYLISPGYTLYAFRQVGSWSNDKADAVITMRTGLGHRYSLAHPHTANIIIDPLDLFRNYRNDGATGLCIPWASDSWTSNPIIFEIIQIHC